MALTKTITWASVSSATIPELVIGTVKRQLIGTTRDKFIDVPGRDGSWHFGDRRGRRKVTAECFVMADTIAGRRAVVEAVANWYDVERETRLYISDEPGVYYEAVVADAPDVAEWRETGIFELGWLVQPYALDDSVTTESWTSDQDDTHTWDPGLDVLVYPTVQITPTNGTLTSFSVTSNSDEVLTYVGLVNSGSTITINSISAVVTSDTDYDVNLTGAYDPAQLSMGGVTGRFPTLVPDGNNTIRFQRLGGTATAITVTVKYRKRYRK